MTAARQLQTRVDEICLQTGWASIDIILADLDVVDETPGPVRYRTWWSPCDTTINPDSSVP